MDVFKESLIGPPLAAAALALWQSVEERRFRRSTKHARERYNLLSDMIAGKLVGRNLTHARAELRQLTRDVLDNRHREAIRKWKGRQITYLRHGLFTPGTYPSFKDVLNYPLQFILLTYMMTALLSAFVRSFSLADLEQLWPLSSSASLLWSDCKSNEGRHIFIIFNRIVDAIFLGAFALSQYVEILMAKRNKYIIRRSKLIPGYSPMSLRIKLLNHFRILFSMPTVFILWLALGQALGVWRRYCFG